MPDAALPREQAPLTLPPDPASAGAVNRHALFVALRAAGANPDQIARCLARACGCDPATAAEMFRHALLREQAVSHRAANTPATFAATPGGAPVHPDHVSQGVHPRLVGTALAYHLNRVASERPELRDTITRALKWQGNPSAAGGDPFRAVGNALRRAKCSLADSYDWNGTEQHLLDEQKVHQFLSKHLPVPPTQKGDSDHAKWSTHLDRVRRALAGGTHPTVAEFWRRFDAAGLGMDRARAMSAIHRLGERALDRAYLHAVRGDVSNAEQDAKRAADDPNATPEQKAAQKQKAAARKASYQDWRETMGTPWPKAPAAVAPPKAPRPAAGPGKGFADGTDHATVNSVLAQLQSPGHVHTRGPDSSHSVHDRTFRLTASDALRDVGRDREADLLARPDTHVMVHQGRVVPARYTLDHLHDLDGRAVQHLLAATRDRYEPDHEIGYFGPGAAGPHTFYLLHFRGGTEHARELHASEVGPALAAHLRGTEGGGAGLARFLHAMRNAPFEEPRIPRARPVGATAPPERFSADTQPARAAELRRLVLDASAALGRGHRATAAALLRRVGELRRPG